MDSGIPDTFVVSRVLGTILASEGPRTNLALWRIMDLLQELWDGIWSLGEEVLLETAVWALRSVSGW